MCGNCRSNDIQESNENDSLCADCGEWMNVEEVRVAPVGGALAINPAHVEAENIGEFYPEAIGMAAAAIRRVARDEPAVERDAGIFAACAVSEALKAMLAVSGQEGEGEDYSLASARGFLQWLVAMDEPEDVEGRADRQTVTLTKIIDKARALLDQTGEPPASQSPDPAAGVGRAGVRLTEEEMKALLDPRGDWDQALGSAKKKLLAHLAASVGEGEKA